MQGTIEKSAVEPVQQMLRLHAHRQGRSPEEEIGKLKERLAAKTVITLQGNKQDITSL